MNSHSALCVALVLTGCAVDTTATFDGGAPATDAAVIAPDAAVLAPDAWSRPDAWAPPSAPSGTSLVGSGPAEVLSSSDACFIQMPSEGPRVYAVRATAGATCAVGTAEYRFSAQYVPSDVPSTGFTPWQTSGQACMMAPASGYGVRFVVEVRCQDSDGASPSVSVSSCVMRGGEPC